MSGPLPLEPQTINKTQEAIAKMSCGLKQFIQELWEMSLEEAIRKSQLPKVSTDYADSDLLSLTQCHKQICDGASTEHLSDEDRNIFKLYRATLAHIIQHRTITALMTNFMTEFVNHLMWITIWYNSTCEPDQKVAADIVFNRKGLTPHLAKAILKNVNVVADNEDQHAIIRDLFRGRYTVRQDENLLVKIRKIAISILTNPESDEHLAFYTWVRDSPKVFGGMKVPKADLLEFLDFKFELAYIKDFITSPKGAYKAWQGTFIITQTPDHYAGLIAKMFEFKFWTFEMQKNADVGTASHDEYKRELNQFIHEVFPIQAPPGAIDFYADGLDLNGLTQARDIYSRNVSSYTIPMFN